MYCCRCWLCFCFYLHMYICMYIYPAERRDITRGCENRRRGTPSEGAGIVTEAQCRIPSVALRSSWSASWSRASGFWRWRRRRRRQQRRGPRGNATILPIQIPSINPRTPPATRMRDTVTAVRQMTSVFPTVSAGVPRSIDCIVE